MRACADECAFLAFDGHTRIVRDLLAAAGQPVEQRGLAAIGGPDQGDPGTADMGGCCRARRAAMGGDHMRTAIGSPPGRTFSITSTRSPAMNPSSIKRRAIVEPS